MKQCSSCSKPAIFHVTLIQNGEVKELHFCEHHFGEYMNNSTKIDLSSGSTLENELDAIIGAETEVQKSSKQQHEQEEELICPQCGISYQEFRKQGRFGCAYDYSVFRSKLYKLLENIHNDTTHRGKLPRNSIDGGEKQYSLLQKKRELTRAVEEERYEDAAKLRDEISELENNL